MEHNTLVRKKRKQERAYVPYNGYGLLKRGYPGTAGKVPPIPLSPHADETILVVDDSLIKRYTTTRALEQAGFAVIQAETGAEGLRLVRQKPSLAILDIKLPDIDGFELCRRIKNDPETANVLVLHFSAHHASGQDLAHGLEEGADAYLAVPVESAVLVATVRALLRLHRAEEVARRAARVWSATFDALSDAVFLVSPTGVISRGNAAAETLINKPAPALVGMDFSAVLDHLGMGDVAEVQEAIQNCGAAEVQTRNRNWLRLRIDALPDDKGDAAGNVCIFSDITVRVAAEQVRADMAVKNERIAETLQRSLLLTPAAMAFPGVEVEGAYEPALSEAMVGGDFSDVFSVDRHRVALVVGDVTGKGLAAAAYTAEIKFALRALLRQFPQPDRALFHLNQYLLESRRLEATFQSAPLDEPARFVALVIVLIDTETRTATCAAAGAEPPLVVRTLGQTEEVEAACGPLLAMDADSQYHSAEVSLHAGDLLILATDGITEARPPGRRVDFFGLDGAAKAAQAAQSGTVREVVDAVVRAALHFAHGYQHDDICLLAARCTDVGEKR